MKSGGGLLSRNIQPEILQLESDEAVINHGWTVVIKLVKQKTSGSAMTLTWSAMAGHTYQVQYKTNMNQAVWVSLPTVTMTNSAGDISVPIGTDPQRYYRVVLLQ